MNKKAAMAAMSPIVAEDEPANKGKRTALALLMQDKKRNLPCHQPRPRRRKRRTATSPAKPKEEEEEAKGD